MVDGRLDAEGAAELERVVAGLSGSLRLDLAGLRSVDDAGLEALRALRARGIALTGTSPYLRLLLAAEMRPKAPESPSRPDEAARKPRPPRRKR
jgi:anti-anti-sigma regulatory factor